MIANSCRNCAWLLVQEFGYSNYSVTDIQISCLKNQHPFLPAETADGIDDDALTYNCKQHKEGNPLQVDVDFKENIRPYDRDRWDIPDRERLEYYTKDPEVILVLKLT
jgi:hypothetical protein